MGLSFLFPFPHRKTRDVGLVSQVNPSSIATSEFSEDISSDRYRHRLGHRKDTAESGEIYVRSYDVVVQYPIHKPHRLKAIILPQEKWGPVVVDSPPALMIIWRKRVATSYRCSKVVPICMKAIRWL